MTRVRSVAVAISLALGMTSLSAVMIPAAVQAAEQAKPKLSKAVGVPLQAAQKAMSAKQWDAALAEIKKAQAVEKRTPQEDYQIDEFLGYILVQQKKYGQAAPVFERMLNSGLVPAEQVDDRTKAVAQMYFQEKEYKKAAEWTKKWLAKHPGDEDMTVLLGQTYYLTEDYKSAASTMSQVIANDEKAGRTPKENYLQIVLSSYFKQDNKDGVADALKKMVRYYPSPQYWENLTDIYRRKQTSDRVTLGFYRLMSDVGVLKDKGDYVEMSQLAIEAGVPGEAESTMQKGIDSGVLKSDDKTEQGRYTRLLDAAKKQASTDRTSLAQQAKDAEKATQGQPSVGLGQAYLSYGMYDEAIAAIQAGIKKGGVTDADEAQIALGIAQMKKGQKDAARQAFKAVKSDSKWADLAALWTLRTYQA
jgi:tetratricopeptide (TPR) repeat protein